LETHELFLASLRELAMMDSSTKAFDLLVFFASLNLMIWYLAFLFASQERKTLFS